MNKLSIVNVIESQINALVKLQHCVDDVEYSKAINLILRCDGKVIISGVGKSGLIGKKISATFSSLGIPSLFINSADALHGDLGVVTNKDVVILISNSGETSEVVNMIPTLNEKSVPIIAITRLGSHIANKSNIVLEIPKIREADELDLAPTCSTTMTLVIGDALACVVSSLLYFTKDQFLMSHPSGKLGEKLKMKG